MAEKIDAIKEELTATPTEALEAFVEKYASDSRTGVQKLVDTAKKRMDKLQKEMIRTENLKKYEKEYDTYTYICGIDEIVEYLKDCDTWELNLRIATLEACNPEKLFSDELQSLVDKALETLPEQTRDIFVRSRYNNQSHKEIAVALGISTKTVEFHITKALKVLRVALKDYFPLLAFLPKFFC